MSRHLHERHPGQDQGAPQECIPVGDVPQEPPGEHEQAPHDERRPRGSHVEVAA